MSKLEGLEPSAKQQEIQSLSALDALTSAVSSKIVPNTEFLLEGSIVDGSVEVLIHRLRGLCDNTDVGPETFHDHEACFQLISSGPNQPVPLTLRVRRAVDDPSSPWHLRYAGIPELGDKNRPTMVRTVLDVAVGSDVVEFLKELGCRREYDFVTKGWIFRKGRLKILVGKLYRYEPGKSPNDLEPVTGSHYVEMSVVTPSGQDAVGEDMRSLAEQLKPLVHLDKVDPRRGP